MTIAYAAAASNAISLWIDEGAIALALRRILVTDEENWCRGRDSNP
jgi:hypothetical protein